MIHSAEVEELAVLLFSFTGFDQVIPSFLVAFNDTIRPIFF